MLIARWRRTAARAMLAVAVTLPAAARSDDCSAPAGPTAAAICAEPGLLELDGELLRLTALARSGPTATEEARAALAGASRAWQTERDGCGAEPFCIAAAYAGRMHIVRDHYPDARMHDDEGFSLGPFSFLCDGLDGEVNAAFFAGALPLVSLRWGGEALVLPGVPSASGARYAGPAGGGLAEFWTRGDAATFTPPGGKALACVLAPSK